MHLKSLIKGYFTTGINNRNSDDKNRKIFIVNLFSFVGMSITAIMAVHSLILNKHPLLSTILGVTSITFYLGYFFQKKTGNNHFASALILYLLLLLMFFLVATGGVGNTGPLWIFMVAPVALYIHGLKLGLIDIAIFVVGITVIMFFPNDALLFTSYSTDFKLRLIYSFLTITFLSGFYEYSRQTTYDNLLTISREYKQLAKLDPLTQISNRRDGMGKLEYEVKRAQRNKESIALLLCDIDHFKKINDTYGHEAGDMVLVELAKLLSNNTRNQDTICRWGGEEFLFILPQTNSKQAFVCAEKIRRVLAKHVFIYNDSELEITISIGVSEIQPKDAIQESINAADKYLYEAKKSGRNRTVPSFDGSLMNNDTNNDSDIDSTAFNSSDA